jgi:hypothetical protein
VLHGGRQWVLFPMSLDFSIYLIFPAALRRWGRLSLEQKLIPGTFLGVKERPACKANSLIATREPIV